VLLLPPPPLQFGEPWAAFEDWQRPSGRMANPDGRTKMFLLSRPSRMPRIKLSSMRLYTTREHDTSVLVSCRISTLLLSVSSVTTYDNTMEAKNDTKLDRIDESQLG